MTIARWCLLVMAVGLVMIGQPWWRALFAMGFPVTLLGIVVYNLVTHRDAQ